MKKVTNALIQGIKADQIEKELKELALSMGAFQIHDSFQFKDEDTASKFFVKAKLIMNK